MNSGRLAVSLAALCFLAAPLLADVLDREIPDSYAYKNFDEAIHVIGERTGFKVVCPQEVAVFMRTVFLRAGVSPDKKEQSEIDKLLDVTPKSKITVRKFLDAVCEQLGFSWKYDAATNVLALDLYWKTSDPRPASEILKIVRTSYSSNALPDLDALLCKDENFGKAWKVRQKAYLQDIFRGLSGKMKSEGSKPFLVDSVTSIAGEKFTLLLFCQPIQMYPGSGSASYYWFTEDGTLAGAGLMNTGHRCKLVDACVANEWRDTDKPSELQMVLKINQRNFVVARFVLEKKALKLTCLTDVDGKGMDASGCSVGKSLMEPDRQ